jgi:predicted CopG family antitoxin
MITMAYKTINISPDTYEKLVLYKHGNMSFDEVLNKILEMTDEETFYKEVLKEHKKRMKKVRAGECIETDSLDEALKQV